jgi:hypothetical protein
VNGVHLLLERQRDDALDVEIGLNRALAVPDPVSFVRLKPMQAKTILFGIDRDRAQSQF